MARTFGVALVGAGVIARVHAKAIADIAHARVIAVCDTSEPACRSFSDEFGGLAWTADLDEMLARDDVDVVSICTPSGTHAELAVRAARAGKHLIVEKPLDVTLARADRIIAAARESGVKLTGIFPYRFRTGILQAKQAIEQGRLGKLVLADAYVKWHRSQEYYRGWHGTWALDGGGALINQAIHSIDVLQWLAGPVETVCGRIATLGHEMEAEDTASATLTFAGGALGSVQAATSCWPGDPARVELHGTQGTIVLQDGSIADWRLADGTPDEQRALTGADDAEGHTHRDPAALGHTAHRMQIEDLLAAVEQDRPPRVSGEEARHAIEIIRAVYLSSRRGATVRLPLIDPEA